MRTEIAKAICKLPWLEGKYLRHFRKLIKTQHILLDLTTKRGTCGWAPTLRDVSALKVNTVTPYANQILPKTDKIRLLEIDEILGLEVLKL